MKFRVGLAAVAAMTTGVLTSGTVQAQMMYPGGYGGYGMSRWGADPGSGYMAALGSYGRSQGAYALDKAKADAINVVTMQKWNKALRDRQIQLAKDKAATDARREAELQAEVAATDARDGTTLNQLLLQILDSDPGAARASRSRYPLSPEAIRDIPFEWASEAVTICLNEMTAEDGLPPLLTDPTYATERAGLREAMSKVLAEDLKGAVSPETLTKARDAVARFRASFAKNASDYDPGYEDAKAHLTTLDALTRTLGDSSMEKFLQLLGKGEERTLGDLIAFMHSFNLRFGPAETDRQAEIYAQLLPALTAVRDAEAKQAVAEASPSNTPSLRDAAVAAFKNLDWKELDAHAGSR